MTADNSQYYIGIMSGTSLDGADVSLVEITQVPSEATAVNSQVVSGLTNQTMIKPQPIIKSIANRFSNLSIELKQELSELSKNTSISIIQLGQSGVKLAKYFAQEVNTLLDEQGIQATQIVAIGCHGVTIRHYPDIENGFTLQITDANTLAQLTGIDVISDFRGMDVAVGGQGAPLVPQFHQVLFNGNFSSQENKSDRKEAHKLRQEFTQEEKQKPPLNEDNQRRLVINLGGIANVSVLGGDAILGFDTGPANTLLDQWCLKHTGKSYDKDGDWAASGKCHQDLLQLLLSEPYFAKPFPKSTGKELFNLEWLHHKIIEFTDDIPAEDVQNTLAHLTTKSVALQCEGFDINEVIVCGGGALNKYIMSLLKQYFVTANVYTADELGVDANAIEAMAFAWLAYCRVNHISANSPSVTGAQRQVVLGAWYSASVSDKNGI